MRRFLLDSSHLFKVSTFTMLGISTLYAMLQDSTKIEMAPFFLCCIFETANSLHDYVYKNTPPSEDEIEFGARLSVAGERRVTRIVDAATVVTGLNAVGVFNNVPKSITILGQVAAWAPAMLGTMIKTMGAGGA